MERDRKDARPIRPLNNLEGSGNCSCCGDCSFGPVFDRAPRQEMQKVEVVLLNDISK